VDAGQVVGYVVVAGLSIFATIIAARYLEKRPDLRYQLVSSGDLVPKSTTVALDIRYQDQPVKNLVQIRCTFINRGNEPIQNATFEWSDKTTGRLVYWACEDPRYARAEPDMQGTILLLNERERTTCEWVFADDPKPELTVKARGVGVVARPDAPVRVNLYWALAMGLAFLVVIGYSVLIQDEVGATYGELARAVVGLLVLLAALLGPMFLAYWFIRQRQ